MEHPILAALKDLRNQAATLTANLDNLISLSASAETIAWVADSHGEVTIEHAVLTQRHEVR